MGRCLRGTGAYVRRHWDLRAWWPGPIYVEKGSSVRGGGACVYGNGSRWRGSVGLRVWNGALVNNWKSTIFTFDIDVSVDNAIILG